MMLKILKFTLFSFLLVVPSALAHGVAAPRPKVNVPILLYHHIEELPASVSAAKRRWSISPQEFESQMEWVAANGFHPISMEQLVASLKNGTNLPTKPIVLSFDDGWKDQYSVVLPILKKHNFVGTFFIITDALGHSAYMNWEEVQQLANAGMDIQSHTRNHLRLPALSHDVAVDEIEGSKKILEEHLHKPVTILAYPYGRYNDSVIAVTKAAGYEAGVIVSGNGGYLLRTDQLYTLPRYALENGDDLVKLAKRKHFGR